MNIRKVGQTLLTGLLLSTALLTTQTTYAQDTIKIGGNLELSGAAAAYGTPIAEALELAIEQKNDAGGLLDGQLIELLITDNQSDLTEAASVATKLISQDVVGIIGPTATGVAKAAIPIITEGEMPTILGASTGDGLTLAEDGSVLEYLFRVCFEDSFQGLAAGEYASEILTADSAIIITDQALDYSLGLADSFTQRFEENGGSILNTQSYTSGDTDFSAILTTLLAQDFDILYIPGYYTETGLIIKQAREMGITQPIIGGDGYHSKTLIELAGAENATDIYFTTHFYEGNDDPKTQQFIDDYSEKFGKQPDTFAALGYDASNLLLDAIERAGSTDRQAIIKAIGETQDFEGITGTFSFDEEHNPIKPALMLKLENGEIVSAEEVSAE
ncbi:ABC transporter substrate-binding protein [Fundicoccus sp. Sow4_D5]|uniref:ABC transporter substrate-binding protein n=1 Tax=unclassified Fundicoccus TaxID=2761543 RepID=UPI003F934A79